MELKSLPTPAPQDLIVLPPAKRAAVALKSEAAEAHLRELVAKTAAITNVVDKNGREEAHRAAMSLKNARVAIKNTGEVAREDAVAFQKAVVSEVARLAAITAAEEDRLFKLRDDFDAKVAAEKAERERIEAERKAAIRAKIDLIAALPVKHAAADSEGLNAVLAQLARITTTADEYAEFAAEASQAVETAAAALLELRNAARQREEAEAERQRKVEADRLELERLRAEQEARAKAEREAAAERERQAQAERDRVEAERRAAAEREAELQRQIAEMKAQLAAAQPQPDAAPVIVPAEPQQGEIIGIPLVDEGHPVMAGVRLVEPGDDSFGTIIVTNRSADDNPLGIGVPLSQRPTDGEIIELLAVTFEASEDTVTGWLRDLVKGLDQ
jgi:hypothetical protein